MRQRNMHEHRALDWWGLRPSTARRCPRALSGRRHIDPDRGPCVCANRILDHPRRWTDRDGRPVLTAEPYGIDGADLAELLAELAALDLDVHLDGYSPYYPG